MSRAEEEALRANLRGVFDQYDTDGSGAVSTDELKDILEATGVVLPPEELEKIIIETDVDNSGEIDFEEFYNGLMACRASGMRIGADGKGPSGLAAIVSQTHAKAFKLFNPLTWFAPSDESDATPSARLKDELTQLKTEVEKLKTENTQLKKNPIAAIGAGPPTPEGSRIKASRTVKGSVRSQRSVLSEWMVRQNNQQSAAEQRSYENELREMQRQRNEKFRQQQRNRIETFRQEEEEKRISIEAFKALKRETGVEMRSKLRRAYDDVQAEKEKRAAIVSEHTLKTRREKTIEVQERNELKRRTAVAVGLQAQEERRRRREESLKTVRKQEQAAKDFAAQVRYETRPDVRKETRDYFQAMRDGICASEKEKQNLDRKEIESHRQQFLDRAHYWKDDRNTTKEQTQIAREKLYEKRHKLANKLRNQLQEDQERMRQAQADVKREIKDNHDVVIQNRFRPWDQEMSDMQEFATLSSRSSPSIREGLKARSRNWGDKSPDRLYTS